MKAHRLIADATYGPEQLKVIGTAFDDAWEQLKPQYADSPPERVEAVRLQLAEIILNLAKNGCSDAVYLRDTALQLMQPMPAQQTAHTTLQTMH